MGLRDVHPSPGSQTLDLSGSRPVVSSYPRISDWTHFGPISMNLGHLASIGSSGRHIRVVDGPSQGHITYDIRAYYGAGAHITVEYPLVLYV